MSDTGGTAELARELRELKGRSGLSYGVLAKRLHMSTSTLHRYCNGDAVPTEFAPVERLARLCRATPDEMVRVHRLWILADAARGKKATAQAPKADPETATPRGAAPQEAASEVPETAPAASPGAAAPGNAPEAAPAVVPEVVPEAVPAVVPEAVPAAGSVPPGADPLVSFRGNGAGAAAPAGKRRRNVFIAVATVLAVAASAVLITQPWDRSRGDGSGNRSVGAVSSITPSASTGADAGASTGAGADGAGRGADESPSVSPSGSGGRTGAGSGAPAAPPADAAGKDPHQGGTGTSGSGTGTAAPFAAAVRPFVYESPCSQYFLVDSPPTEVAPPPGEQDAPGWAASYQAVSADDQLVALTLQGRSKETVVLQALHVRVVRSTDPLPWNRYAAGVGCGGNVDTKSFTVDLDAGRPATAPHAGQRDFPYSISETDPEVFYVKARARTHDVSWYLELEWSSGGRRGIQRIDDHGAPFRTSGSAGRPLYVHPLGSSAWEKPLDDGSGEQHP